VNDPIIDEAAAAVLDMSNTERRGFVRDGRERFDEWLGMNLCDLYLHYGTVATFLHAAILRWFKTDDGRDYLEWFQSWVQDGRHVPASRAIRDRIHARSEAEAIRNGEIEFKEDVA